MIRFDHIGIVCRSLEDGQTFLTEAFGITKWSDIIHDPIQKVLALFGTDAAGIIYELLTPPPNTPDSPISAALKQGYNIINHMAYRTPDLGATAQHLRGLGCFPISEPAPAMAFDGCMTQFFYSPLDYVFELIEDPDMGKSART